MLIKTLERSRDEEGDFPSAQTEKYKTEREVFRVIGGIKEKKTASSRKKTQEFRDGTF